MVSAPATGTEIDAEVWIAYCCKQLVLIRVNS